MTWLALLLKPFIWPLMEFFGRLAARWTAIVIYRVMPAGKARTTLFDQHFLERHDWLYGVALFLGIAVQFVVWFWPQIWGAIVPA